ncbi:MAG: diguanylate cyclase [Polyangiaceae bacterium]
MNGAPARIAVSDGDAATRRALVRALEAAGHAVEAYADTSALVSRVELGGVDLVVADAPRLCRAIKGLGSEVFVPVVLTVAVTDPEGRIEGVLAGADACLDEPFEEVELFGHVDAMLRLKRAHDHYREARRELERESATCPLTGLFGYRYLRETFPRVFAAAEEQRLPLSCLLVDVDGLRRHNVERGRAFGDSVLVEVASSLRSGVREADVVVRYGPDEFLVLLPETHFGGAMTVAERVFDDLAARKVTGTRGELVDVPVSMGVAVFPGREVRTRGELLRAAAEALSDAKRGGGGRVSVFRHAGVVLSRAGQGP